ncbi:IclR family transcriptional regulator [Streptomyces sp. NPDC059740]|uniref:IclR family transcriptional regulator n=1 Tax=Streptomyces sp. NPDC059740 TaxID=3346926 RepID=UPI003657460D
MALQPEPNAPLHAVRNALRVLDTVSRHPDGVTDSQIARATSLPTPSMAQMLAMLRSEGYVQQLSDGAYVTGSSLTELGSGASHDDSLRTKLQETLADIRDSVGAAVYVSRYIDGEVRILHYADGPGTPKVNEWAEFRRTAHANAVGKCLLAQLDHDGRKDHLSRHKTARLTSRTITNERVLFHRLDSQPPTVPVLDLQEYAVGTVCAAVPITAGSAVGCLAVSMPLEKAHRLRKAAETLNRRAAPVLLALTI